MADVKVNADISDDGDDDEHRKDYGGTSSHHEKFDDADGLLHVIRTRRVETMRKMLVIMAQKHYVIFLRQTHVLFRVCLVCCNQLLVRLVI